MPELQGRRDPLLAVLALTGMIVLAGGLALGFFGIGAELQRERQVTFVVKVDDLDEEVARQVKVGDPVFVDPGGMPVGEVSAVKAGRFIRPTPDSKGVLHAAEDPVNYQVKVTVKARGREGRGLVVLDNQVMQAGQSFNLISDTYYLRGTVIGVDVR